ncbi:hypothetical protein BBI11_02260 [Planococcus maritimus]|nr:hypothetical protein BBI11_02260 [Planococcus maritimus]
MNNGYKAFRIVAERFFLLGGLVGTRVGKLEMKRSKWKSSRLSTALQGAAWGSQDATHAADATGRRAFSCPSIGRVPGQDGKKNAVHLSRQPARSHRRQPPSTPSLVLEGKKTSPVHSIENEEMLHVL